LRLTDDEGLAIRVVRREVDADETLDLRDMGEEVMYRHPTGKVNP